jgi:hypothetical protein
MFIVLAPQETQKNGVQMKKQWIDWCHNIQHNDIQHNDTKHSNRKCGTEHGNGKYNVQLNIKLSVTFNWIRLSVVMLSVIMLSAVMPNVLALNRLLYPPFLQILTIVFFWY